MNQNQPTLTPADNLLLAELTLAAGQRVLLCGGGWSLAAALAGRTDADNLLIVERDYVRTQAARRSLKSQRLKVAQLTPGELAASPAAPFNLACFGLELLPSRDALTADLHAAGARLRDGGRLYLVGSKAEGVDSAGKQLATIFGNSRLLAYKGGQRLYAATKTQEVSPLDTDPKTTPYNLSHKGTSFSSQSTIYNLQSDPAVFNRGLLDPATALLAEAMQVAAGAAVLDLGCGSGILGLVAARLGGAVSMVDSNSDAVELARRNAAANGLAADIRWGDAATAFANIKFDVIVTNPPFHVGRKQTTDPALAFIARAAALLKPGGTFYLVANRFLPYEKPLRELFSSVTEVAGDGKFKVLRSEKLWTRLAWYARPASDC